MAGISHRKRHRWFSFEKRNAIIEADVHWKPAGVALPGCREIVIMRRALAARNLPCLDPTEPLPGPGWDGMGILGGPEVIYRCGVPILFGGKATAENVVTMRWQSIMSMILTCNDITG